MGNLFKILKKCIPNSIKSVIKKKLGIPEYITLGEGETYNFGIQEMVQPFAVPQHQAIQDNRGKDGCPIQIAIHAGGGLGDLLLYVPIIDEITLLCDCTIDFYSGNLKYVFAACMPRANVRVISTRFGINEDLYDLVLDISHCISIKKAKYQYLQNSAPLLFFALEGIERFNSIYGNNLNRHGMPIMALRQSKFLNLNKWDFLSAGGVFHMREQRSSILIDMNRFSVIAAQGLHGIKYVVVNRGADPTGGGHHQTKVWPKERYEEFVQIMHSRFPSIKIIQVKTNHEPEIAGVDEIIGDADIEDVKAILKCAAAYVGSEGGMGHLATQMSIPCVIVFGPTPESYYGYKRNINIVSPVCSECMEVTPDWYVRCPRGFSTAKCMEAISGEMVADAVTKILDSRKTYSYILEHSSIYSSKEFKKFKSTIKNIAWKNSMDMGFGNGHIFGPVRTYIHSSKRWEYPYILERIDAHGKRLKIADVGAGRGALSLYLAGKGHDVTIYDMDYNWDNEDDPQIHTRFMRYCAEHRVKTKIATGFNLPEDADSFDVVISTSVIEHVIHKTYMLQEMLRVLKPGGILILTYDLIESDTKNALNSAQIEVLTPSMLHELLSEIGISANIYDESQIVESRKDIHSDGLELHPGITVGGCVIRKHSSLISHNMQDGREGSSE